MFKEENETQNGKLLYEKGNLFSLEDHCPTIVCLWQGTEGNLTNAA